MAPLRPIKEIWCQGTDWPDSNGQRWWVVGHWVSGKGAPECVGIELWKGVMPRLPAEAGQVLPLPGTKMVEGFNASNRTFPIKTLLDELWTAAQAGEQRFRDWGLRETIKAIDTGRPVYDKFRDAASREEFVGQPSGRRLNREHFREVAAVYGAAPKAPTAAVAAHFTVSHSTATKWVARAAEFGLLTDAPAGGRRKLVTDRRPKRKA